jgi:hypothetical protein
MYYRSFSFFWPLCCLSYFDLRILITLLVSSSSSLLIHFLANHYNLLFSNDQGALLVFRILFFQFGLLFFMFVFYYCTFFHGHTSVLCFAFFFLLHMKCSAITFMIVIVKFYGIIFCTKNRKLEIRKRNDKLNINN